MILYDIRRWASSRPGNSSPRTWSGLAKPPAPPEDRRLLPDLLLPDRDDGVSRADGCARARPVLAIAYRRRSEYHKRLMVLATVALMGPAIVRAVIVTVGGGFATRPSLTNPPPDIAAAVNLILVPAVLSDLLLLIPAIHDWRTRGRPHAVYVAGGIAFVALHLVRPLVAATPAWHSITDGLIALTR